MECNKISYLFIIYFVLQITGLIKGSNIDCNGKAFHCTNSTHFKICVDLGGGVSKTVDEFLIPCPPYTFCKETNYFECEFEITTTSVPTNRQEEVTNEPTQSADVLNLLDVKPIIPLPYLNKGVMLERLFSTITTTYDSKSQTAAEITPTLLANNESINIQNNNSGNIYNGEADILINAPISTVDPNPLTTAEKVFNEIKPHYVKGNSVPMQYLTEQPRVTEVVSNLTLSDTETTDSDNINTLNLSVAENLPATTTINFNVDDDKNDTLAQQSTKVYKMIRNNNNITSESNSLTYNYGTDKIKSSRNNMTDFNLRKLNEDFPAENINHTFHPSDEQTLLFTSSTDALTFKTNYTKHFEEKMLSNSTDFRVKNDIDLTAAKSPSIDTYSTEIATLLPSDQNNYDTFFLKNSTNTNNRIYTSANESSTKKLITKNIFNFSFLTLPNTTEISTPRYSINDELPTITSTNDDVFQSALNQNTFVTSNFNVTISNTPLHEIKKNYSDNIQTTHFYSYNTENLKLGTDITDTIVKSTDTKTAERTTSSPLLKETLMKLNDEYVTDTKTPYFSELEISTQKYFGSYVSTVSDYDPPLTSVINYPSSTSIWEYSDQNKTNPNVTSTKVLQDKVATQETYTRSNSGRRNKTTIFFQRGGSTRATEKETETYVSKKNTKRDQEKSIVHTFSSITEHYETTSYDYPINNEVSTKTFTNKAQETTTADYQLYRKNNKNETLPINDVYESTLDPIPKITSQEHENIILYYKQTTINGQGNITNDTNDLTTLYNPNVETGITKHDMETREIIKESSDTHHKLLSISSTLLQNLTTESFNLHDVTNTNIFLELEVTTEKYYYNDLSTEIDNLAVTPLQTYKTSKVQLINDLTQSILDFSKQNKTNLYVTETNLPSFKDFTVTEHLFTPNSYQRDNHTHVSTRAAGISTEKYKIRSNKYTINNNEFTHTNGEQDITEPNNNLTHNMNSNETVHLNRYVFQSVLHPITLLKSRTFNNTSSDIKPTNMSDTKDITIETNNIAALNESNLTIRNRQYNMKPQNTTREPPVDTVEQNNLFAIIPMGDKSTKLYDIHATHTSKPYFSEMEVNTENYFDSAISTRIDNLPTTNSKLYVASENHAFIDIRSKTNLESSNQNKTDEHVTLSLRTKNEKTSYQIPELINTPTKSILYFSSRNNIDLDITSNKSENKSTFHNNATELNNSNVDLNEQKYDLKIVSLNSDLLLETLTASSKSYVPNDSLINYDLDTTSNLKEAPPDNSALLPTTENNIVPILNDVYKINIYSSTPSYKDIERKTKKELPNTKINNQYFNNEAKYSHTSMDGTSNPVNIPITKPTKNENVLTHTPSSFLSSNDRYLKPTIAYVTEKRNDERILEVTDIDITLDGSSTTETNLNQNVFPTTEYISTQEIGTSRLVDKKIENYNFKSKKLSNTSNPSKPSIQQSELIPKQDQELVRSILNNTLKRFKEQVTLQMQYLNESQISHDKPWPHNVTSLSDMHLSKDSTKFSLNSTNFSRSSVNNPKINENQTQRLSSLGLHLPSGTYNETDLIIKKEYSNHTYVLKKQTIKMNKNTHKFTASPTQAIPKITQNSHYTTTGTRCLKHYRGKYSDRNNCRKFYICVGEITPLIGECPVNTVFSEIKKQCTTNLSHCIRNNQFRCLTSGRYYDIFLMNTYYICVPSKYGYIKFQFQCLSGYTLNKTTVRCIEDYKHVYTSISVPESSNTNERSESSENNNEKSVLKVFKCESVGKFADPNDCRKYYICSKNNKSEFRRKNKKCDSDEVWHREEKKCVDDDSYECKLT